MSSAGRGAARGHDRQERPGSGLRAATPRRVFLYLVACTALALGLALNGVWALGPRQRKGSAAIEIELDVERLDEHIALLAAWFGRAKQRPRWTAHERLLILEHAERHHLSAAALARDFLLSDATAHRWRKARRSRQPEPDGSEPATGTNGLPPCRRICDSRRELVARMAVAGFGGHRTMERHLKLQGESLSARSIQRFRRTPSTPPTTTPRPRTQDGSPEPLDQALVLAAGRIGAFRPRVARLLRILADAFGEGIAAEVHSALERSEEPGTWGDRARLRSRRAAQLAILLGRLARIPPRHRPRYTAAERARILAVLCDLSFERPNCYFEAGFAKGSFRRVIFTARADHDPRAAQRGEHRVHFDVDQLRITFWNPEDLPRARTEVEERLANVLREIQPAG
jgi:transposase-like protein